MTSQDTSTAAISPVAFDNSFLRLPERLYARVAPTPVRSPRLLRVNSAVAGELGIDPVWLAGEEGVSFVAGNSVLPGSDPVALAYAGHQFGHFVPQLGDGRAVLLGEVVGRNGTRFDIQLKGSGRTPFSRSGDGRAAIGPILREFIVSEAMAALEIPTTRVLAAVATGEPVFREDLLPGAVLARVARSHARIGTFQYLAVRDDKDAIRALADYLVDRLGIAVDEKQGACAALLAAVVSRTASLVARWQGVGFIHGVMNTDNMSIAGETIDYGPCAFMDAYHPGTVFSSIDERGRYAYGNQPPIAYWNLAKLAESLVPVLGESESEAVAIAQAAIDRFPEEFEAAYRAEFGAKLGFGTAQDADKELLAELLEQMADGAVDFTLAFRRLSRLAESGADETPFTSAFKDRGRIDRWLADWRGRLAAEGGGGARTKRAMLSRNPAVIARNHRVELALRAAESGGDLAEVDRLIDVLANPFDEAHEDGIYAQPPMPEEVVKATFCGT
jgi:uncharacterized protein YdiU (UPF0061 family)